MRTRGERFDIHFIRIDFSARGIVSRSLKIGDWITFRLMCRERGSVLFSQRKTFEKTIIQNEPERLIIDGNQQQYAHLLLADENLVLSEIIEREKMELLRQLEEDGDQPEACFIKQALEENNVKDISLLKFGSISRGCL